MGAGVSAERASRILALKNTGLAQLEETKYREAKESFSRLAELVPAEALPPADEAVATLRAGDPKGAEKLLARAEAISPNSAELFAIGAAFAQVGNDDARARTLLARAAALSPRDESRWRWIRSAEIDPAAKLTSGPRRDTFGDR